MQINTDLSYLNEALMLAQVKQGFCAPNPSVGAIIVRDDIIIGRGYHLGVGTAHAEIDALNQVSDANGATLYVTLEPCCHWGRTPPCTDAVIKSGIKRVVFGYKDPNPIVSGKGEQALMDAGIRCDYVASSDIDEFYASYAYWHTTKMPYTTAKIALTLDGKIADSNGQPLTITGAALKEFTHYSRKITDAILTTSKTIINDDPQLNVRYKEEVFAKPLYILDSQLLLPLESTIFNTAKSITVFHGNHASLSRQQILTQKGVRCIALGGNENGLDLSQALSVIGQDGVHHLWVEAGGKCFSALLRHQLIQRALIYVAPKWIGKGKAAFSSDFSLNTEAKKIHWQQFGNDVLCEIHW